MQRENPDVDVPIRKTNLHYSFVWDKYPLITPDPAVRLEQDALIE